MNPIKTWWKDAALLACVAIACGPAGAAGAADPRRRRGARAERAYVPKGRRSIHRRAGRGLEPALRRPAVPVQHRRAADATINLGSSTSVGGLPANTTFKLALWNATGNGENSLAGTVTTDAAGVARFEVPLQAAFSLTTVPVS